MKKLALLMLLLVLAAAGAGAWAYSRVQEPYRGFESPEQFVVVPLGAGSRSIGDRLVAAGVVRDFILRPESESLKLRFVQSAPIPFPPEPFRSVAVNLVRHELDRADRNEGRRGILLKTLDAMGIGFDS